jgi:hypothetical protein
MLKLKEHITLHEKRIRTKPTALVEFAGESSVWDRKFLLLAVLVCIYILAQAQDL